LVFGLYVFLLNYHFGQEGEMTERNASSSSIGKILANLYEPLRLEQDQWMMTYEDQLSRSMREIAQLQSKCEKWKRYLRKTKDDFDQLQTKMLRLQNNGSLSRSKDNTSAVAKELCVGEGTSKYEISGLKNKNPIPLRSPLQFTKIKSSGTSHVGEKRKLEALPSEAKSLETKLRKITNTSEVSTHWEENDSDIDHNIRARKVPENSPLIINANVSTASTLHKRPSPRAVPAPTNALTFAGKSAMLPPPPLTSTIEDQNRFVSTAHSTESKVSDGKMRKPCNEGTPLPPNNNENAVGNVSSSIQPAGMVNNTSDRSECFKPNHIPDLNSRLQNNATTSGVSSSNGHGNEHGDAKYTPKYVDVVRNKAAREALPGHTCRECAAFYEAMVEQGIVTEDNRSMFLQSCSRHKAQWAIPDTPESFWDISVNTPAAWK
jgi:hypothetical protein